MQRDSQAPHGSLKIFIGGISFLKVKKYREKIELFNKYISEIVNDAGENSIVFLVFPENAFTQYAITNDEKKECLNLLREIIKNYKNVILIPGTFSYYNDYAKYYTQDNDIFIKKMKKIKDNYSHLNKQPRYHVSKNFKSHYDEFKIFYYKLQDHMEQSNGFSMLNYVGLKNGGEILLSESLSLPKSTLIKYKKSAPYEEKDLLRDKNQLSFFAIGAGKNPIKKLSILNNILNICVLICHEHDGFITHQHPDVQNNPPLFQVIVSDSIDLDKRDLYSPINIHMDSRYKLSVHINELLNENEDKIKIEAKYYSLQNSGCIKKAVPIQKFNTLHLAAKMGDIEKVKKLLEGGEVDINLKSNMGTPLYLAAEYGHLDVVKLLLQNKANLNLGKKDNGYLSLHIAAEKGHFDIVKVLISASEDLWYQETKSGETPFHLAVKNKHHKIVQEFLEYGVDVNLELQQGVTALTLAIINDDLDMVNLLLEEKADPDLGFALFQAVINNRIEIVQTLVKQESINLKIGVDDEISIFLDFAREIGNEENMKKFLNQNQFENLDKIHISPAEMAEIMGHTAILDLINEAIENRNIVANENVLKY